MRIGKFVINHQFIISCEETARAIMGRVIVVRCEMMYAYAAFEYMAISPDFDEVPDGTIIPKYDVIISDGGQSIEFKRSNAVLTGTAEAPLFPISK